MAIPSTRIHRIHWWHMATHMMNILILLVVNMPSNNYHTTMTTFGERVQ